MTKQASVNRLDAAELGAWRGFLEAHARVVRALDQDLQDAHGLPLSHYEVLLLLHEAPERRLRMAELAERSLLTPSGISRLVDRLGAEGLVVRERCASDRRGLFACLTEQGEARFAEARPTHLAGIRRRFLAALDPGERAVLGAAWARILAQADSGNASG